MTIEELLSLARSKGLYLNNLFEHRKSNHDNTGNGKWQANFRHVSGWCEFGFGDSPLAALTHALERSKGATAPVQRPDPSRPPILHLLE